ncbi:MAG TPA: hypothetical protein VNQ14_05590 [Woeseiaceae bacterium]|nr:hypothetical protein [Woeseiaceae bacterium]
MSQLHFYIPDDEEKRLRERARQAKMPLSRYLAELVRQQAGRQEQWPENYFERVFGKWEGEPLRRALQGEYEERPELD